MFDIIEINFNFYKAICPRNISRSLLRARLFVLARFKATIHLFFFFVSLSLLFLYMLLYFLGLLFHRTMLLSGSGLAPWSLVNDPAKYAAIVSHHVNCAPELSHSQLMKCLRERPLDAILSAQIHQPDFGNAFGPSIDGVVIGMNKISLRTNISTNAMNPMRETESFVILLPHIVLYVSMKDSLSSGMFSVGCSFP